MDAIIYSSPKKNLHISLDKLLATWILCWIFVPPLQVGNNFRIITVICSLIWGFLAFSKQKYLKKVINLSIVLFAFIFLVFISNYFYYESFKDALSYCIQYIIIFICLLISIYYYIYDKSFLYKLFIFLLILISVFSITTIQGVLKNPYASRIANSEWLEDRFEENKYVGLYGFVYMCVFIEPMLLYVLLKGLIKNRLYRIIAILSMLIIFVMLLLSGYMIANTVAFFSCLGVLIFNKKNIILTIFVGVLTFIFFLFYSQIISAVFDFLIKLAGKNPVYHDKLNNFKSLFLNGDATGYTVAGRFKNYQQSINLIVNYPVIGSYLFGTSAGGHSALLDIFGRYGLFVGIIFCYIFFVLPQKIVKVKGSKSLHVILMISLLVFLLSDPYFQEIGIPLFIFFPVVKMLEKKEVV